MAFKLEALCCVRYLCELTGSAKFFNFREAQRRPRNPLPNIRVIYAVKVWIRLLYIDKGGRAADFTLMWVFSGTFVNVMFSQSPFLYFIMKGQLFNITPNNALFKDK